LLYFGREYELKRENVTLNPQKQYEMLLAEKHTAHAGAICYPSGAYSNNFDLQSTGNHERTARPRFISNHTPPTRWLPCNACVAV
jgi:hypothetical protein